MGKISREVRVTGEGEFMTASEIMMACAEVPEGLIPTVEISMNGKVKSIKFKVEFRPDGPPLTTLV